MRLLLISSHKLRFQLKNEAKKNIVRQKYQEDAEDYTGEGRPAPIRDALRRTAKRKNAGA
jgi:hypothetical protein